MKSQYETRPDICDDDNDERHESREAGETLKLKETWGVKRRREQEMKRYANRDSHLNNG